MKRIGKTFGKRVVVYKEGELFFTHIDNEYRTIFNSTRELETISEDKSIFLS